MARTKTLEQKDTTAIAPEPTKTLEQKDVISPETTGAVHHMTRGLAGTAAPGKHTADQLDAHCRKWIDQGYRLFSVHPTYVESEQGPGGMIVSEAEWHILYIFVKD